MPEDFLKLYMLMIRTGILKSLSHIFKNECSQMVNRGKTGKINSILRIQALDLLISKRSCTTVFSGFWQHSATIYAQWIPSIQYLQRTKLQSLAPRSYLRATATSPFYLTSNSSLRMRL